MALDPISYPDDYPWGVGCCIAEQMAGAWGGFQWRKDGEETTHPSAVMALGSVRPLLQGSSWDERAMGHRGMAEASQVEAVDKSWGL